jgi:uroporphyrinogen decarboxylase
MYSRQEHGVDYLALPLAEMEAIFHTFEAEVNEAQRVQPASKELVRQAVRRKGVARCPVRNRTLSLDIILKYGNELADLYCRYPDDVVCLHPYDFAMGYQPPGRKDRINPISSMIHTSEWTDEWGTRWKHARGGVSAVEVDYPIKDWSMLDGYLESRMPRAGAPGRLEAVLPWLKMHRQTRYCIGMIILGIWERLQTLRGYENAFMDHLDSERALHRLIEALTQYVVELVGCWAEIGVDAVFLSDDWGTQQSLMISREMWSRFYRAPYRRVFDEAHRWGLDIIFHSCGNVEEIIPDLIDIGLDVLNPLQPGAMNLPRVAKNFGGHVAFFGGIDDQNLLSKGTPEQVREEARRAVDTLGRPYGNAFIMAPANVITPDVPLENIEALMEAGHGS